jgi:hypothetical protein
LEGQYHADQIEGKAQPAQACGVRQGVTRAGQEIRWLVNLPDRALLLVGCAASRQTEITTWNFNGTSFS